MIFILFLISTAVIVLLYSACVVSKQEDEYFEKWLNKYDNHSSTL